MEKMLENNEEVVSTVSDAFTNTKGDMKAKIVAGVAAGVTLLTIGAVVFLKKKKRKNKVNDTENVEYNKMYETTEE